jgi:hypothetical protein
LPDRGQKVHDDSTCMMQQLAIGVEPARTSGRRRAGSMSRDWIQIGRQVRGTLQIVKKRVVYILRQMMNQIASQMRNQIARQRRNQIARKRRNKIARQRIY